MTINRRHFMGAGALALLAPLPALADGPRVFDLYRGRSKIGSQTLTVNRTGDQVNVSVSIDIDVRIMGLSAYRYQLESRETWLRGALQTLSARTNDNGSDEQVVASAVSGGVRVEGTAYEGVVSGNPATTTYWTQAFLERPVWISTQNGYPLDVQATKAGTVEVPTPTGPTTAVAWNVRGDIGRLDLFYDRNGEWIGNAFEARGEQARFVLAERGRDIASLW